MAFNTVFAAALLAQAGASGATTAPAAEQVDVAYEEMVQGRSEAAIARIRANRAIEPNDPAALINLGAAHMRIGRPREAQAYFVAAIVSPERYDLQLADGRWMDSRRAARLAIALVPQGRTLAVR